MNHDISLSYPSGLVLDIKVNEFNLLADYPVDRGGYNIAISPWEIFLTSIIACQGINIAKFCKEKKIDYTNVKVKLVPKVVNNRDDEYPEYELMIDTPEDFPIEYTDEMVTFINNCPVTNHLTKLKPIIKTIVNDELKKVNARQ